jgi:hypothetical protein
MRRNKDGTIHQHSKSLQMQYAEAQQAGKYEFTPRQAWLGLLRQSLTDTDYFAPKCKADEAMEAVTFRAACRLLIEYLERNK